MDVFVFILYIAALVLFLLASMAERIGGRVFVHFGWLGAACFTLAVLIDRGAPK